MSELSSLWALRPALRGAREFFCNTSWSSPSRLARPTRAVALDSHIRHLCPKVLRCPRVCVGYKAETAGPTETKLRLQQTADECWTEVVALGKGRSCVSSKLSVERPLSLLQARDLGISTGEPN